MSKIFKTRRHTCFHSSGNKLTPQRLGVIEVWAKRAVIAETQNMTLDVIVVDTGVALRKASLVSI